MCKVNHEKTTRSTDMNRVKLNLTLPENQRPWSELTLLYATDTVGHFTYTLPCKTMIITIYKRSKIKLQTTTNLCGCLVNVDVEGAAILVALFDHILLKRERSEINRGTGIQIKLQTTKFTYPHVIRPAGLVLLRRVEHVRQHEARCRDRRNFLNILHLY